MANDKEIIRTNEAPQSPAYSQAVKAAGLIFVAGQGPFDPETGAVVGSTIQEQTRQCLKNIEAILKAAGSSMNQVVSTTFILSDPQDFTGMTRNGEIGLVRSTCPAGREVADRRTRLEDLDRRYRSYLSPGTDSGRVPGNARHKATLSFAGTQTPSPPVWSGGDRNRGPEADCHRGHAQGASRRVQPA